MTNKMQLFWFIRLFHLIHDISRMQYWWTISETVNTVKYSWLWAKTSPETCGTSARCCNYSLHLLLMMGERITRNMYSSLQEYNKVYIVAPCCTIIDN